MSQIQPVELEPQENTPPVESLPEVNTANEKANELHTAIPEAPNLPEASEKHPAAADRIRAKLAQARNKK